MTYRSLLGLTPAYSGEAAWIADLGGKSSKITFLVFVGDNAYLLFICIAGVFLLSTKIYVILIESFKVKLGGVVTSVIRGSRSLGQSC
jgi:hypothetical protein